MYKVVWRYVVPLENQPQFELAYSADGAWATLFKQSEDYLGSRLNKSEIEGNTYILIDSWNAKDNYERFLQINKQEYQRLNEKFQNLYNEEERMGTNKTNPFIPKEKEV